MAPGGAVEDLGQDPAVVADGGEIEDGGAEYAYGEEDGEEDGEYDPFAVAPPGEEDYEYAEPEEDDPYAEPEEEDPYAEPEEEEEYEEVMGPDAAEEEDEADGDVLPDADPAVLMGLGYTVTQNIDYIPGPDKLAAVGVRLSRCMHCTAAPRGRARHAGGHVSTYWCPVDCADVLVYVCRTSRR